MEKQRTEKTGGKTKNESSLTIEVVLAVLGIMLDIFFGFREQELSRRFFLVFLSSSLCFVSFRLCCIMYRYVRGRIIYRNKMDKLLQDAYDSEEIANQYGLRAARIEKKWENAKKKYVRKPMCRLAIVVVVVFGLCIANPQNTKACLYGVKSMIDYVENYGEENEQPQDSTPQEKGTGQGTEASEKQEENNHSRDMGWKFILDEPYRTPELDDDRKAAVFFEDWGFLEDGNTQIWKLLGQAADERPLEEGVDYEWIEDENGNDYYDYTSLEDGFLARQDSAAVVEDFEEWLKIAPHSSELDVYIRGRERLNTIELDGKSGCYELWEFLANDYQRYAMEYERQTQNDQAVLYYYTNSIYCCMEALKYAQSEEQYDRMYHYMVMRYHDMCRDESIIQGTYKSRAEEIFLVLKTRDKLWEEE